MFNINNKILSERTKLDVTDEMVVGFLNGSYEKDLVLADHFYGDIEFPLRPQSELQGIRVIEASASRTSVDIIFAKAFQKDTPRITHRNGLQPFLWAKHHSNKTFFTHNVVILTSKDISETHVRLPYRNQLTEIDGLNCRILKVENEDTDNTKYFVRYKLETLDEWNKIVDTKKKLYGIDFEKQIISFETDIVARMDSGFKYKYTIKNQSDQNIQSDNPYFQINRYNQIQKIKGTFDNLLDFFREGGIASRGTKYFDDLKFRELFNSVVAKNDIDELNMFYLQFHKFRKEFNPFTTESADWTKIITLLKRKNPNIAWKIDKSYIDKQLFDNCQAFYENLKKLNATDLFNVQLDKDKLITYLIECYTFDSNGDQRDLTKYIESCGYDFFRIVESQLFYVSPREQYMIQTGRRLFKGIENYEDLDIMTVDIETKALRGNESIETAALSPKTGRIFEVGIGDNKGFTKFLHAKEESEEQSIIEQTYQIIAEQDPDILLTYNGEDFDFMFMEQRLALFGCKAKTQHKTETTEQYIINLIQPYCERFGKIYSALYKRNDKAMVKIGGDTVKYTQTLFYGRNTCDVIHAVKRAAAIDTSIPDFKLKNNIIHAKLAAPDRVYVKGNMIGFIESDTRPYYLNKKNGNFFVAKKEIKFIKTEYDRLLIRKGKNNTKYYDDINMLYMYGETGSENSVLKGCLNAFPIQLHYNNSTELLHDDRFYTSQKIIYENFICFFNKVLSYDGIVCNIQGLGESIKGNTQTYEYLLSQLKLIRIYFEDTKKIHQHFDLDDFENIQGSDVIAHYHKDNLKISKEYISDWQNYESVTGADIIKKYLEGDIQEPYLLDGLYSQSTFEISKWLPTSYEKVATMGGATVWKLILSTWSYLNCIAIPDYEPPKEFTGGLVGMVSAGFHKRGVKIDYSSLYPAEFLEHVEQPDIDISGIYKMLMKFGLYTRLDYKKRKGDAKKLAGKLQKQLEILNKDISISKEEQSKSIEVLELQLAKAVADQQLYDKKQLPLKILINSFYGMLGAPNVSPFCHINSAWHITCSGRQHMRHLIHYFSPFGFKIIYFHTDGANFIIPDSADDYSYVGEGLNWLVEKGKLYKGVEAYVAEYNDKFMRGRMGVDIDEYFISCINFAKGNFSYLKEERGELVISHVGGTLLSKAKSQYIKTFVKKNLMAVLKGNNNSGVNYVDAYYDYILSIYNMAIVSGEICSRSKVKKSIADYLKHVKNGGNAQAHMELAIMHNLRVEIGDYITYINIGKGKKQTTDLTNEKNTIGAFTFTSKEHFDTWFAIFKNKIDDKDYVSSTIKEFAENTKEVLYQLELVAENKKAQTKAKRDETLLQSLLAEFDSLQAKIATIKSKGCFIYKYNYEQNMAANAKTKNIKISKEILLDTISDIDEVKVKYVKKSPAKKEVEHTLEVIFATKYMNVKLIQKEELDAIIPYNAYKYIAKFNQAISALWVIFKPEIRKKIPTPNVRKNTGEDYDRNSDQRGYFLESDLELISGIPLAGQESKQQNIEDLQQVTDEEMQLYQLLGLSPNNSFDYSKISYESMYSIDDDFNISLDVDGNVSGNITGYELAQILKDKIIIDKNKPPYRFV